MLSRCIILVPLALALAGCEPGTFYTEVKGQTTLEGDSSPLSNLLGTFEPIGSFTNMDFDSNADFQNEGVSTEHVRSVRVTAFTLKIVSPDSQDFDFLDELSFFARVGENEQLIAEATDISARDLEAPNPRLELEVTHAELQPFVAASAMSIVMRGNGRVPPQDTTLEAAATFRVQVQLAVPSGQ